ncbi:uncharacterized protein LOC108676135 [Hyalella azteca]|uniref:Uncharacterized protein LOC108676135 n=1 Tax=Hyalella azteca TaxID=294128 RepID=A0A8B7P127_HYAAZ|nr:uncharacterized protein LOC108676135 [Hyalella azteca]
MEPTAGFRPLRDSRASLTLMGLGALCGLAGGAVLYVLGNDDSGLLVTAATALLLTVSVGSLLILRRCPGVYHSISRPQTSNNHERNRSSEYDMHPPRYKSSWGKAYESSMKELGQMNAQDDMQPGFHYDPLNLEELERHLEGRKITKSKQFRMISLFFKGSAKRNSSTRASGEISAPTYRLFPAQELPTQYSRQGASGSSSRHSPTVNNVTELHRQNATDNLFTIEQQSKYYSSLDPMCNLGVLRSFDSSKIHTRGKNHDQISPFNVIKPVDDDDALPSYRQAIRELRADHLLQQYVCQCQQYPNETLSRSLNETAEVHSFAIT